ncbi:uncharacterized protein LOC135395896 [Ornithodoros turicata]|uniref:uncharacterized protein LOC135395896 n=1 Tax=Ornithodoros turicata TaxID=34597 RepID=UPI003139FCE2
MVQDHLQSLSHNHEALRHKLDRQVVRAAVKQKAAANCTEKPSRLICAEIRKAETHEATLDHTDMKLLREAAYRARRRILPRLPKSREDVHKILASSASLTTTNRGESFVLANDSSMGVVVLSCASNVSFLCTLDKIFMDGTFRSCTKYFKQLFTIHGLRNGIYVPLVFSLLPSKEETRYLKVMQFVKQAAAEAGKTFEPTTVVVDFETAIHNAVRLSWPNANIVGCRFHLGQAWWRKIQKLGLSPSFKRENSEVGLWLKQVYGLPYLPPSEVADCFVFDMCSEAPREEKLRLFMDYLVDEYIKDGSRFPPEMWAEMTDNMQNTTNACESFHSRFNGCFYSPHPDVFRFLSVL